MTQGASCGCRARAKPCATTGIGTALTMAAAAMSADELGQALYNAAKVGDDTELTTLLDKGALVNWKHPGSSKVSLLLWATSCLRLDGGDMANCHRRTKDAQPSFDMGMRCRSLAGQLSLQQLAKTLWMPCACCWITEPTRRPKTECAHIVLAVRRWTADWVVSWGSGLANAESGTSSCNAVGSHLGRGELLASGWVASRHVLEAIARQLA